MTFTATEPVSDAPNDAALDAETVTEPAATSALMVEELLPFTQTWPLEKTFDPSSIDASAVLAIWFTATEPPAERLPPPEPPAPTVSATAPASAVMSELSVDVTLTSPA